MTEGIVFSPSPFFYVIIGFLVGLILGWVIGFFDSNNRSAKKIEASEKNAEIKAQEAERRIRKAEEQIALAAQASATDDPGLLRLKNDSGRYMLEMDGAPLTGALSSDKKRRLIDLLSFIRPYLEGGQPQQAPAPKPAAPQTPPAPVSTFQAVTPQRPISRPVTPAPVEPIKPTLAAALNPTKKAEEKPLAPLSIVGQIDSVLQARLVNTPLEHKGISLHESRDGAVEVIVGLTKYPSIDDVPDAVIRTAIRAAIAEWEVKFTPGL
ncbi:MAG: hypothetical protein FJ031_12505 [Chloroflexi bacterium]|nr:hypothetical protein [Chloroflexota bacterium]